MRDDAHPAASPSTTDSFVTGPAAVLWDMDGTLVDSEKLWGVALHEVAGRLGTQLSETQRRQLVGSSMDSTAEYLLRVADNSPSAAAVAEVGEWIRERATMLFADALPWRPGAQEALRAVRFAGIPCALVTSTERALTELALNSIGRQHFGATVCGDEVDECPKPHPWPYQLAASRLSVRAADCVTVEDSPPGVASAAAAGCTVLVVPSDVPVEAGARRVFRSSLVGVDVAELVALTRRARACAGPPASAQGVDGWKDQTS